MHVCSGGRLAIWPLAFISILLILVIMKLTHASADPEVVIYTGGLVAFFIWIAMNIVSLIKSMYHARGLSNVEEMIATRTPIQNIMATQSSPRVRVAHPVAETVMAQRRQYRHGTRLVIPFCRNAQIARLAMRALPPVQRFTQDEIAGSILCECPICMEKFNDGELIQPFGFCDHEFHSSCLIPWLHSGNTTCPVCRKDLTISIHARGTQRHEDAMM